MASLPVLRDHEEVNIAIRASRRQNWARAVGGRFFVTSERLVFIPHFFDRWTGGFEWECHHNEIEAVTVSPPRISDFFSGGIRSRLSIIVRDQGVELFVVPNPRGFARTITGAVLPR
jgi:hypothetical protein